MNERQLNGRAAAICAAAMMVCAAARADAPKVSIEGIDGALLDNVRAHLQLEGESCDAPSWRIRRLYREADADVRSALEAFGYYSARVDKRFQSGDDCWSVVLTIDPGEPVVVRVFDVRVVGAGAEADVFRKLVDEPPIAVGDPLNHADYTSYKNRFTRVADRRGYFDGRFVISRIDVYPDERAADIVIAYDTGVRYTFGDVIFEQDVVRPELAEGYIGFERGQPYDARIITRLYEDLLATGYFYGVDIRTTPRGDPHYDVATTIRMTAAKHRTYSGGVGFGTDVGVRLRAGFHHRRLNRKGHQFEVNANWSDVIADIGAGYRLPMNDPRNNWLNFDAGYRREDNTSADSETWKVGAKLFRRQTINWLLTYFIDYGYESWQIGVDEGNSRLLIPGVSWDHSMEQGPPRPTSGIKANLSISGAADWLLSDTDFLQVRSFGKLVHPLWKGARGLARAEVGYTMKNEFDELPASVRFFAGGDVSVRGYEYKSLGPRDEFGLVVGGTHLAVMSYEVDQLVRQNWSVAAFVDAGNAFNSFADMDLQVGVGIGVRWFSLLGPIRLDFAVPLADDAPDAWRIHITLGPDL